MKKHPGSANSGIFGQKHRHNPSQEMTHVKNRPRFRKGRGLEKKNAESILLSTNGDSATIFFIFFYSAFFLCNLCIYRFSVQPIGWTKRLDKIRKTWLAFCTGLSTWGIMYNLS